MVNKLGEIIANKKVYLFNAIKKYYVSFITPFGHNLYQPDISHNDILNKALVILRGKFWVAWLWGCVALGLRDPDKMI